MRCQGVLWRPATVQSRSACGRRAYYFFVPGMSEMTSKTSTGANSGRPTDLNVAFPAADTHAFELRRLLRGWCSTHNISGDTADDALLVSTELFTNAVKAAQIGSSVEFSIALQKRMIVFAVSNVGKPFELESLPLPSIERPGGRGLVITRAIGTLNVTHSKGTTTVRAALPIDHPS